MTHARNVRILGLAKALGPSCQPRIVDVGANPLGKPPYRPLVDLNLCDVWGFEPQDEAHRALVETAGPRTTYLKAALGGVGEATLNVYPDTGMTSLRKLREATGDYLGRFRKLYGTETEQRVTLTGLDALDDLPGFDLLKIDTQGAELDILKGGAAKLSGALAVIVELRFYQLYEGEPMLDAVDGWLRGQGFVLHRFLHLSSMMLRHSQERHVNRKAVGSQLVDGDAVYIRALEDKSGWNDEDLKRLALLADAVFGSFDLTLVCLDTLIARSALPKSAARDYVKSLPQDCQRIPDEEPT